MGSRAPPAAGCARTGGYRVVDASGPSEALAVWRDAGPIDALVTDVVHGLLENA